MNVDDVIYFTDGKTNARGYPLTGKIQSIQDDGTYTVVAFGLAGPGSETTIHAVPQSVIALPTFE